MTGPFLVPSWTAWPCRHLDLGLLASSTVRSYISVVCATRLVVLCRSGPSRRTQEPLRGKNGVDVPGLEATSARASSLKCNWSGPHPCLKPSLDLTSLLTCKTCLSATCPGTFSQALRPARLTPPASSRTCPRCSACAERPGHAFGPLSLTCGFAQNSVPDHPPWPSSLFPSLALFPSITCINE